MRFTFVVASCCSLALSTLVTLADARAEGCQDVSNALGVSRVIEIDTAAGPMFGDLTKAAREPTFLEPMEVVLTFDDGPIPRVTQSILDTLDAFCTRATFFPVGDMAVAYPAMIRAVAERGHTVGAHTWSHPNNLRRLPVEKAVDEIEHGYAAVAMAAGTPVAPFFRFPGLSDSGPLLAHLKERGIASFTVDVISNDSYIGSPKSLADRVLRLTAARKGGILLFHDIKTATAKALPAILDGLRERGFKVVHLVAKSTLVPITTYDDKIKTLISQAATGRPIDSPALLPVTAPPMVRLPDRGPPEVSHLAPAPREILLDEPGTKPMKKRISSDVSDPSHPFSLVDGKP